MLEAAHLPLKLEIVSLVRHWVKKSGHSKLARRLAELQREDPECESWFDQQAEIAGSRLKVDIETRTCVRVSERRMIGTEQIFA